jgi:hypothetical protein
MLEDSPNGDAFDRDKPLFADWKKADLLFQLTNEELSGERSLFEATKIKPGLLQSYLLIHHSPTVCRRRSALKLLSGLPISEYKRLSAVTG